MDLRAEIVAVARDASLGDSERSVRVTGILTEALIPLGVRPVLVGGMAVAFWTPAHEFTTRDIDLVMDDPPETDGVLRELGFEPSVDGRHWEVPGTDLFVELPSRHLPAGAEVTEVNLADGRTVSVLSQVDVLVVRLEELAIGPREDLSRQALALIPGVDRVRLRSRAADVGVSALLERFLRLADEIAAGVTELPDRLGFYDLVKGV